MLICVDLDGTLLDPAGHPFCLCRKEKKVSTAAIRRVDSPEEKRRISREILESLPEWFGIPEAREEYIAESAGQTFFAAEKDGSAVGFLCLKQTGPKAVELAVMGVCREYHRRGCGRALFAAARDRHRTGGGGAGGSPSARQHTDAGKDRRHGTLCGI